VLWGGLWSLARPPETTRGSETTWYHVSNLMDADCLATPSLCLALSEIAITCVILTCTQGEALLEREHTRIDVHLISRSQEIMKTRLKYSTKCSHNATSGPARTRNHDVPIDAGYVDAHARRYLLSIIS